MALSPKLAATALVASTVATLSCSPAYADPVVPPFPRPDLGTVYTTWETVDDVASVLFRCRQVEVDGVGGTSLCVEDPLF